jgi:hypothetical protein
VEASAGLRLGRVAGIDVHADVRDLQKALGRGAKHARVGDIMTPAEQLVTLRLARTPWKRWRCSAGRA